MIIKTHLGIAIDVDGEGKFHAQLGDKVITRRALRDVEKAIEAEQSGTPAFVDNGMESKVRRVEIAGVEKRAFRIRGGDLLKSWHGEVYLLRSDIADALDALAAQYQLELERFEKERNKLLRKCKRLEPSTFKASKAIKGD